VGSVTCQFLDIEHGAITFATLDLPQLKTGDLGAYAETPDFPLHRRAHG
jgi:hypothetical protein